MSMDSVSLQSGSAQACSSSELQGSSMGNEKAFEGQPVLQCGIADREGKGTGIVWPSAKVRGLSWREKQLRTIFCPNQFRKKSFSLPFASCGPRIVLRQSCCKARAPSRLLLLGCWRPPLSCAISEQLCWKAALRVAQRHSSKKQLWAPAGSTKKHKPILLISTWGAEQTQRPGGRLLVCAPTAPGRNVEATQASSFHLATPKLLTRLAKCSCT